MNTDDKGNLTEAVVLSELAKAGYTVLVPFGVARYDLAVDDRTGGGLKTVQCKTGRMKFGCINFASCSRSPRSPRANYRGQVDYFGVWCPDLPENAYLVPVDAVGTTEGILRIEPAKNNQSSRVRWADEFRIKGM